MASSCTVHTFHWKSFKSTISFEENLAHSCDFVQQNTYVMCVLCVCEGIGHVRVGHQGDACVRGRFAAATRHESAQRKECGARLHIVPLPRGSPLRIPSTPSPTAGSPHTARPATGSGHVGSGQRSKNSTKGGGSGEEEDAALVGTCRRRCQSHGLQTQPKGCSSTHAWSQPCRSQAAAAATAITCGASTSLRR